MGSYRLHDRGFATYKVITYGRKDVGRVCSTTFGHYLGIIGKTSVKAATEADAFREVVAKHLGFASVDALQRKNAQVAAKNRAAARAGRFVAEQMLLGNFEPFERVLLGGIKPKEEE